MEGKISCENVFVKCLDNGQEIQKVDFYIFEGYYVI